MSNDKQRSSFVQNATMFVVMCIAMYFMVSYVFKHSTNIGFENTQKNVDKIQKKIDSLNQKQEQITFMIETMNDNNAYLMEQLQTNNALIQSNQRELSNIKKMYNGKIRSVNSHNVSELDSIFSNRYGSNQR
jgi:peptidoglycan hydrolase CwlO-like protein